MPGQHQDPASTAWLCPRANLTKFQCVATQLEGIPYHVVYLIDVQAHCGGRCDAHIQDQRVTLGLQVVAQLLTQLLPWLLQAKHAVRQDARVKMIWSKQ